MRINFKDLKKAVNHISYNLSGATDSENLVVEVSQREENFENGQLGTILTLTIEYDKPPQSWESVKVPKHVVHTIEIFPQHENHRPRVSTKETQELSTD